jgi:hypothetical protein
MYRRTVVVRTAQLRRLDAASVEPSPDRPVRRGNARIPGALRSCSRTGTDVDVQAGWVLLVGIEDPGIV